MTWTSAGSRQAFRAKRGLRRLDEDAHVVDRLTALGAEGMASGIDEACDVDAFVEETRPGRCSGRCS